MIEIKQKITGTVLLSVEADTLRGANLSGAYLSRAYLSRAYLSVADLSGANLSGAYLSGVRLLKDQQSDLMSALGVKVMP